jgi:hypothetical protein
MVAHAYLPSYAGITNRRVTGYPVYVSVFIDYSGIFWKIDK